MDYQEYNHKKDSNGSPDPNVFSLLQNPIPKKQLET